MLNWCLFFLKFRFNNKRYNVRVKLNFDKDIYEIYLYWDWVILWIVYDIINSNYYMKYFVDVLVLFCEYYVDLFYFYLYD